MTPSACLIFIQPICKGLDARNWRVNRTSNESIQISTIVVIEKSILAKKTMKQFSRLLYCCAISTLYIGSLNAQITITRADLPKPTSSSILPDSVAYTQGQANATSAQNFSGANLNIDESQLDGTPQYARFVPMSATPLIFQLVFLSCDYARPLLGSQSLGNGTLSDAYEYYNYSSNNDRLEVKGFGGNLLIPGQTTAIPVPALYSSPDVIYRLPLNYGNTDSSNSGFDVTVPLGGLGNIQIKRVQKRVNEVDAWGNLQLPTGNFQFLRVRSEIDRVDSLITQLGALPFASKPIEYRWLSPALKIPALELIGIRNGNTANYTQMNFWGHVSTGYTQQVANKSFTLYPNPTTSLLQVRMSCEPFTETTLNIVNFNGAVVAEFHFKIASNGQLDAELPLEGLPSGNYLVTARNKGLRMTQSFLIR